MITHNNVVLTMKYWESGIHVVLNAPENSKTEREGIEFVDPEK